jgi:chromosome segregation ATPase
MGLSSSNPQSECEFDPDHLYHEHRERDELRAEAERLQRENGALARMYALSEEKLRQRTEAMNDAQSEVTSLAWGLSEATKEIERLQAQVRDWRAWMEKTLDVWSAEVNRLLDRPSC